MTSRNADDAPAGIRPGGCVVNPADENWAAKDDAEVYNAAVSGVPQAQDELARRSPGDPLPPSLPCGMDRHEHCAVNRCGCRCHRADARDSLPRGQHGPAADYGRDGRFQL